MEKSSKCSKLLPYHIIAAAASGDVEAINRVLKHYEGYIAERIIMEQKSVSTEENLLFSRKLMDKEAPKIVIVTTAYHVFRALILAKQQGLKCVGFGAKTKWYFTLNALIREFVGYLRLTWKKHALVIGIVASIVVATNIAGWLR